MRLETVSRCVTRSETEDCKRNEGFRKVTWEDLRLRYFVCKGLCRCTINVFGRTQVTKKTSTTQWGFLKTDTPSYIPTEEEQRVSRRSSNYESGTRRQERGVFEYGSTKVVDGRKRMVHKMVHCLGVCDF